ncbi:Nitrate transport protein NrtA precursor [Dermatophilus congolensis]|uniref:Nitrate transport protein NrtA n=1 Tax=Dermatophilus congolensis TaxID=1863 RepID=A0A239V615_9MICO|nr:ABC transporter substrate-binding protein [Dermatophilus congolensis]SNV17647.1 Nitrate transport protein NrtA precursor [Dermatophilus congolensis]
MSETFSRRKLLTLGGRAAAAGLISVLTLNGGRAALNSSVAHTAHTNHLGRPLRIGYLPITDAAALLIGHAHGYFAAAGTPSDRPVMFRTWESLAQALLLGKVDVVHLLMPLALQMKFARQAPIRVVAWGHTHGSALTVRPDITDVRELAGHTLAVPQWWSIHNVLLQQLLQQVGLSAALPGTNAGNVHLVVMPPAEMVSALAAKKISGFVVAEPFPTIAATTGVGHTLRYLGDLWQNHACCAIVVREELLSNHPRAAASIVRAVMQAQDSITADLPAAATHLTHGAYLPQPGATITQALTRSTSDAIITQHAHWHGERIGFTAYPRPSYTARLSELLRSTRIDGDTTFLNNLDHVHEKLVEPRFVEAELRRLARPIPTSTKEVAP